MLCKNVDFFATVFYLLVYKGHLWFQYSGECFIPSTVGYQKVEAKTKYLSQEEESFNFSSFLFTLLHPEWDLLKKILFF